MPEFVQELPGARTPTPLASPAPGQVPVSRAQADGSATETLTEDLHFEQLSE